MRAVAASKSPAFIGPCKLHKLGEEFIKESECIYAGTYLTFSGYIN